MEYRLAKPADIEAIRALWADVFEDDNNFIDASVGRFAGWQHVYVALSHGRLVAQLLAVPCTMQGVPGCYLYALATNPTARRTGVMTELMQWAEGQEALAGKSFAALIPANEGLFGYYRRRGYQRDFMLSHLNLRIAAGAAPKAEFARLSAGQFARLREEYIHSPYVSFSADRYEMLLDDLYASGAQTAFTASAYAMYFAKKDHLLVAELFGKSEKEGMELLRAIAAQTGLYSAHLTLHPSQKEAYGFGELLPYALWKPLLASFEAKGAYLRFGFDEIK